MPGSWQRSVEGWEFFQRERLTSVHEGRESIVKTVETDLSTIQAWLVLPAAYPGVGMEERGDDVMGEGTVLYFLTSHFNTGWIDLGRRFTTTNLSPPRPKGS